MKKLLQLSAFMLLPFGIALGQERIAISSGQYVVLNGGTSAHPIYLLPGDPTPSGISSVGGGIISESEYNIVQWNIGTNTGTYIVPFTYSTTVSLPLTLNISSAGTGAGVIKFSTYHTVALNTPLPSDVTNLSPFILPGSPSNSNDSYKIADRFYIIDANTGYTAQPTIGNIIFSYISGTGNTEVGGSNTLTESHLMAQRFNSTNSTWSDWFGYGCTDAVLSNVGTVSTGPVPLGGLYRSWSLWDNTLSLPLKVAGVNATSACNNNGSATATVYGGKSPYTYSWSSPGGSAATLSGLSGGTYTLSVSDANSCSSTASVTITQPATVTASVSQTSAPTCNGNTNGVATASVSGGTPTITYTWNNGNSTTGATLTAGAGTYTVTVTDHNGCSATASVTMTQPALVTAGVNLTTSPNCNGNNGTATASSGGGTGTITYKWSNSATGATLSVGAGTYTVTATDAHSCSATASVTITQPTAVSITIASTSSVTCPGSSTGSITANAATGGMPFVNITYSNINTIAGNGNAGYNGEGNTATSTQLYAPDGVFKDASGNIFITDYYGGRVRKVDHATTIANTVAGNGIEGFSGDGGQATSAEIYAQCTFVDASGNMYIGDIGNNRIRKVNTAGIISTVAGTGASTYNGDGIAATSANINEGQNVYVDAGGNIYIPDVNNRIRKVNTAGIISTIAGTGTAGYNGDGIAATSAEINYPIGIWGDASGNIYFSEYGGNRIRKVNTSGIISTLAGTGTAGYNGDGIAATSAEVNQPYSVVTDASGNIIFNDMSNERTRKINASGIISTIAGNGTAGYSGDGSAATSAEIHIDNGVFVDASYNVLIADFWNNRVREVSAASSTYYTYSWSPSGGTNLTASNLSAGTYTITATDTHGCSATASITISQPNAITASASQTQAPNCNGGANGSATASSGGGTGTLTYLWNNNSTAALLTGIAGSYTVTATDAHGCSATASVTITQPAAVTTSAGETAAPTCNSVNGTALASSGGGTGTITYKWSNTTTGATLTAGTGTYTVTATDTHGCSSTVNVTITQAAAVTVSASETYSGTYSNNNATAIASGSGGTGALTYLWNNGNSTTGATLTAGAGTYSVTASDTHGCSATASVTITQPGALTVSATETYSGCNGMNNATAIASASGGTAPISYLWSNSINGATLTAGAATYTITATDAHGSSATASITISQPAALADGIPIHNSDVTCNGNANGSATAATPTGGGSPYKYAWNGGTTSSNPTNSSLSAGTYTVTVTDANSCTVNASSTVIITQPAVVGVTANQSGAPGCYGSTNGSATASATGGTLSFTYTWNNNATGATLIAGAGTYIITATDANGCSATASVTISQPAAIIISTTTTSATSCPANGSATLIASGGTPAFTYHWSNNATAASISASAGTYTVTVTDAHGCSATKSATISLVACPKPVKGSSHHDSGDSAANISEVQDAPMLYQNIPNPFSSTTKINYYLPEGTRGATLVFFDIYGRQIKVYDLSPGNGTINISMGDLSAGFYSYSLVVNNEIIDTKRIILQK